MRKDVNFFLRNEAEQFAYYSFNIKKLNKYTRAIASRQRADALSFRSVTQSFEFRHIHRRPDTLFSDPCLQHEQPTPLPPLLQAYHLLLQIT